MTFNHSSSTQLSPLHLSFRKSRSFSKSSTKSSVSQLLPDKTPGPGTYDIHPDGAHQPSHVIQLRPNVRHDTISSQIDIPNLRSFPQTRPQTIGIRRTLTYYYADPTPGPALPQPETLCKPQITIGNQIPPPAPQAIPGPGSYDPILDRPSRSVLSMRRSAARGDLWASTVISPDPGTYDVGQVYVRPTKKWTRKLLNAMPLPVRQLKRNRS
jgi:hypothetical protein